MGRKERKPPRQDKKAKGEGKKKTSTTPTSELGVGKTTGLLKKFKTGKGDWDKSGRLP